MMWAKQTLPASPARGPGRARSTLFLPIRFPERGRHHAGDRRAIDFYRTELAPLHPGEPRRLGAAVRAADAPAPADGEPRLPGGCGRDRAAGRIRTRSG